jgi:hypothetical protein
MTRCCFVTAISLLLGCGSSEPSSTAEAAATPATTAGAEQQAAAGPAVSLRFAWPDGLALQVVAQRKDDKGGKQSSSETRYLMRAQAVEGGMRIIESDFELAAFDGAAAHQAQMAKMMGGSTTVSRIAADGSFQGIEDAQALVARLHEAMQSSSEQPMTPEQRAFLEQTFSAELLTASAAVEWQDRVGFWVGSDLELGTEYELSSESALPFPGTPTVKLLTRFGATQLVPCKEGEAPRCVRIQSVTDVDPSDMERATAALLKGFGAPGGAVKIKGLEVTTELVLITDPATLVPLSLTKIKRTRIVMTTPDGDAQTGATEHKHVTFTPVPSA